MNFCVWCLKLGNVSEKYVRNSSLPLRVWVDIVWHIVQSNYC